VEARSSSVPNQSDSAKKTLERRADNAARATAAVVLVVGLIVIVLPALLHMGDVWRNPFVPSQTEVVEVTMQPDGTKVTKTTTEEAPRSFVERALAAGGLLLLRIGAVVLASFIAGAAVQRAILGRFDMKLGPLELPDLKDTAEETEAALGAVQQELKSQVGATKEAMKVAAVATQGVIALRSQLTELSNEVAQLAELLGEGPKPDDAEPGTVGTK
jgi:hypothetical protein